MTNALQRAAVLGAGSWGTAFAAVLCDAGMPTTLWARRPRLADAIETTRTNPEYHPGVVLPRSLTATADVEQALAGADLVILAVTSQTLRANLASWRSVLPPDALLVSLIKGIERGSGKRMTEVIRDVTALPTSRIAVLSGPNLSREIVEHQPAAAVVACSDADAAVAVQHSCATPYFRPYTNTDVVGCELGGAVKNVIALAVGMAEGMGLGDNARASLITRGLAEMTRLGAELGANPMTFAGLAGLGDLVATCSSPLSRNRTVGEQIGRGLSLREIAAEMHMVAEGVESSRSIVSLARRHGVDMPIAEHVVAVLDGALTPGELVQRMMSRQPKSEQHPWERLTSS